MNDSIAVLLICGLIQIAIINTRAWNSRRLSADLLFVATLLSSLTLILYAANRLWALAMAVLSLYQLFNLCRIAYSRIQTDHLQRVTRITALRLWLLQLLVTVIGVLLTNISGLYQLRWIILSVVDVFAATVLLASTIRHKRVTHRIHLNTKLLDSTAPTLSVAIPARNETDDLYECLLSLLQCDYPKLEILVLDDQSTIKRTPEIIRSFAHDGVVFVAGRPVEKGWLAKNWAYQQLLEAANGDVVLFCGADTRFSKGSLRFLVSSLVSRNKTVASILPQNIMSAGILNKLVQPLRYCWEICLPRKLFRRPPVLSTCWLAKRSFLISSGGFKAVSRRIVCESYFARNAAIHDGYSFFQYDGINSEKKYSDQLETAIRLRYPQLHRQPELVALVSMFEIGAVLGSFCMFVGALVAGSWIVVVIAGIATLLLTITFGMVSAVTYRKQTIGGYLVWPLACLFDLYLLHVSMYRYEFGTVLWKGRSVAPPVMHAEVT